MYPKKESFPLFPFHPTWNLPWKHLASFRLQGGFCAQKTCKVCSLQITLLPPKPISVLHDQQAGPCQAVPCQAVFMHPVNCCIYNSFLRINVIEKNTAWKGQDICQV